MYLVFILYALFASVFTIAKTGLHYAQPLFFVGSRMATAGLLLLLYLYFFDRQALRLNRQCGWLLARLAFFNIYLTNILEFSGLQHLTSFKTCFIYSLSPFFSALLSYWACSETMTPKKWKGLLIGFLGFLPILLHENSAEEQLSHFFFFSWAELAVVGAAISSVYGWILLMQLVKDNGVSPVMANGMSMLIGGIVALFHSFCVEQWNPIPVTEVAPFFECALLLILISNLTCYNLYGHLLKKFTPTFMSFAGFTTPLFTAVFGWVFLGEEASLAFYLSTFIVFVGLYVFYQEELKTQGVLVGQTYLPN